MHLSMGDTATRGGANGRWICQCACEARISDMLSFMLNNNRNLL